MHAWQVTPEEAIEIQKQLRHQVVLRDDLGEINHVAGVDAGFQNEGKVTHAAIAVLEFPLLALREVAIARCRTSFPYVPGLLSFRELPAVMQAMDKLTRLPDLLLCDGQGYAHPRRFGIACHLGVLTGIPTIGVGKTRLTGQHQPVVNQRGAWQPLLDDKETIGAVLRTRVDVKPIYVSAGHRITLETAIAYVLRCTTRYKLPETTRMAHKYASGTLEAHTGLL
jgi:deoxyribonuclease V